MPNTYGTYDPRLDPISPSFDPRSWTAGFPDPDRIANAVASLAAKIAATLDEPGGDEVVAALRSTTEISHDEWAYFGDKASLALANGRVTAAEATTLKGIHTRWSNASTAERIAFIVTMKEVLG